MKLPLTFEKLRLKQYELTGRQRLMVLGLIGSVVTLLTVVYTDTSEVTVETRSPSANSQAIAKIPSKPGQQVAPVNQATASTRDPFALPPEAKVPNNEPQRDVPLIPQSMLNPVPTMIPRSAVPSVPNAKLKLTGIMGDTEQRIVVIKSDNKSKSYGLNEFIGTYQITKISDCYVVLTNADGNLVLNLE